MIAWNSYNIEIIQVQSKHSIETAATQFTKIRKHNQPKRGNSMKQPHPPSPKKLLKTPDMNTSTDTHNCQMLSFIAYS